MSASGRHRIVLAVLAGVLSLPALAGCGSGHGASPSASSSTMSDAQILALGKELAQCIREHGVITHDPEVAAAAHRRVELRDGRVVADSGSRP